METLKSLVQKFERYIPQDYDFEPSPKTKRKWLGVYHGGFHYNGPGLFSKESSFVWIFSIVLLLEAINFLIAFLLAGVFLGPLMTTSVLVVLDLILVLIKARMLRELNLVELQIFKELNETKRNDLKIRRTKILRTNQICNIILVGLAMLKGALAYLLTFLLNIITLGIFVFFGVIAWIHIKYSAFAINAIGLRFSLKRDFKRWQSSPNELRRNYYSRKFKCEIPLQEVKTELYELVKTGQDEYEIRGFGILFDCTLNALVNAQNFPDPSKRERARHCVSIECADLQNEQLKLSQTQQHNPPSNANQIQTNKDSDTDFEVLE